MKIRSRILPRSSIDIASFLFIITIVPFGYCFALFYILPSLYPVTSFWYILHATLGSFVFVNLVSNFVFIMITDTSVEVFKSPRRSGWNLCSKCNLHFPPRAWHCGECNTCILRRDHHCQFTGCCIGLRNHRYFFFFLLYMSIGTTYALYFHTRFVVGCATKYLIDDRYHGTFFLALVRTLSYIVNSCYILFYGVTFFGMGASMFFLYYHASTMAKGMVLYERSHNIRRYDSGSLVENVTQILGEKWYLVWISPLVSSALPEDGGGGRNRKRNGNRVNL